jgi:hypothetical protein
MCFRLIRLIRFLQRIAQVSQHPEIVNWLTEIRRGCMLGTIDLSLLDLGLNERDQELQLLVANLYLHHSYPFQALQAAACV